MIQHRTARTARTAPPTALLLALVAALVLSLVGPGVRAAHALPDLPPVALPAECTVPSPTPRCVFRQDPRPPAVVFEEGFTPHGTNRLLINHLRAGEQAEAQSFFIGTVRDAHVANATRSGGWVYMISVSDEFYSVSNSLAEFTRASALTPGGVARAARAADLLAFLRPVDGWASLGPIPPEQVIAAYPQTPAGRMDDTRVEINEYGYMPPEPTQRGVYGINGAELDVVPGCPTGPTGRARAAADGCVLPQTEAELEAFHEGFDGAVEDVAFTPFIEDLTTSKGLKLAPLRDTNQLLTSFDTASGTAGLAELRTSLAASLPREAAAFHALTTDETLVTKVMAAAGRTVDVGSELIPYVGLAATGYALREDVRNGDWTNAGFDSVALALQGVEAVQPELAVFVEPLLLADLAAQWTVNHFRPGPPAPPPTDLRHLWEAADEWDAAADVLEPAQARAGAQHLGDAFAALRQEQVHDVLGTRLAADLQTLDQIRYGYVLGILQSTRGTVPDDQPVPADVRAHEIAMLDTVSTTFADLATQRTEQYRAAVDAQVLAAFDHAVRQWVPGDPEFDRFSARFEQAISFEHLVPIEATLFSELRSGTRTGPVSYPAVCATAITHSTCTAARRQLLAAESARISTLHHQRLRDPAWAAGARAHVVAGSPDASWPDGYLDFTSTRNRGPGPEQACTSGRFTSPDGWQRATIKVCAQSTGGTRLSYTAYAYGEYFWSGRWYENDEPVRVTTHAQVRDAGTTLTSGTNRSDARPWCSLWIGCTPTHATAQGTLTHAAATSGLVVTFHTTVTGMYWSDPSRTNPGSSDIAGAAQTVYIPAIALARITDPAVRSIRTQDSTVTVKLDAAYFAAARRYVVTVNGAYSMETYAGARYYGSGTVSGSTAVLSRTVKGLKPGDVVVVASSAGRPGSPTSQLKALATYTVE